MAQGVQKNYGLVGFPLGHSFSQGFFTKKFEAENINAQYVNFEIPTINDLPKIITDTPNLCGFNVTIPYKEKVLAFLDEIDDTALEIKAVNTVKVIRKDNGAFALKGYNTDITGFVESIKPMLSPYHRKALILGTGGASKAVYGGLKTLGIAPTYVSRSSGEGKITYKDLTPQVIIEHNVIVNATPLGMFPNIDTCPVIPYDALTPQHLCFDLVYNPASTLFMKKSQEHGATVSNGLEMLTLQALAAWDIWNG